jgi:transcriptional regulator with XRE-family HTH domain
MASEAYREALGEHFNEGARALWRLIEKGATQTALAELVGVKPAVLSRWLYGDRRPELVSAVKLESRLGIAPGLWHKSCARDFVLPVNR